MCNCLRRGSINTGTASQIIPVKQPTTFIKSDHVSHVSNQIVEETVHDILLLKKYPACMQSNPSGQAEDAPARLASAPANSGP